MCGGATAHHRWVDDELAAISEMGALRDPHPSAVAYYLVDGISVAPPNYIDGILRRQWLAHRGATPTRHRSSAAHGGVDATSFHPVTDNRLEIVDEAGVLRLVVGALDTEPERSPAYGLSIRGSDGAEHVSLSVTDEGASLVFVRAGNIALHLGVDDTGDPDELAGAFITIADARGVPVLEVTADDSGGLEIRTPTAEEPP